VPVKKNVLWAVMLCNSAVGGTNTLHFQGQNKPSKKPSEAGSSTLPLIAEHWFVPEVTAKKPYSVT
jgi:hypothetical protein